jgi:exopolyphosphatase/guanosine-5'-triphosphate,3'-diphosphate pyrophosphatase
LSADGVATISAMRVGVIDVGSNTIRLLAADVGPYGLEVVHEHRVWARLGVDVARTGEISAERLEAAKEAVAQLAKAARHAGCLRVETLVASPGRQAANAGELVRALETVSGAPVRVLGREEEALLGYQGAVAAAGPFDGAVAVCDVGGGSTQLAIGLPDRGPSWLRSFDVGSLRLTTEALDGDPPGKSAVNVAREHVERELDGLVVPLPGTALAVGGSARALRRLVGRTLGEDELREAVSVLRKSPSRAISKTFDVPPARARTLLAGALILSDVQRRLMVPFRVVAKGLREGAVLELAARRAAAA